MQRFESINVLYLNLSYVKHYKKCLCSAHEASEMSMVRVMQAKYPLHQEIQIN